ncbi:MAG: toll/interleukin-1 receptor domain-containing protein [Chloroflexota bacterium]|nr:toll/interleukin-1 receptor domain-containing protein [Chloroflexota bacterium]
MARIYITHHPQEEAFALQIARSLVDLGADVWIDLPQIPPGRFHNNMAVGFETCEAMVAVLSPAVIVERQVIDDWNTFHERGKPVVLAARQPPATFGIGLQPGQYVDFAPGYETGLAQLVATLRYHNALPSTQAPPQPAASVLSSPPTAQPTVGAGRVLPAPPPPPAQRQILGSGGLLRRGGGTTQPSPSQETAYAVPSGEAPRRNNLLIPIILGVLLALIALGALVFLVLLPQQERANQEATQVVLGVTATEQQRQIDAQGTAEAQGILLTQQALAQTQAADAAANQQIGATETAVAMATAMVNATVDFQVTQLAATLAAEDVNQSRRELIAVEATLTAQALLGRGILPPIAPTTNRFTEQSLLYSLQQEWIIGDYAVRLWEDPTMTYSALTIDRANQPRIQVDSYRGGTVSDLTRSDVTGNGNPDVVFEMSYGGATGLSCSVMVYDLGARALRVAETPAGACGSRFADLNSDRAQELIVGDTTFAYQFCSGAESPIVEVVLAYDRFAGRYIPLSANFPQYYRTQAEAYMAARADLTTQLSVQAEAGQMESVKCAVLGAILPYLYGGMGETAWREFARLYPYADAAQFRAEILDLFNNSPFCK